MINNTLRRRLHQIAFAGFTGFALLSSASLKAIVSDNLLTNDADTTAWQNCEGSNVITDDPDQFDPGHLENSGCAYRETPATPGLTYKMTCGVSSFKYSSITLAFHSEDGETLESKTTEIYEDTRGGAYSVELVAPANTSFAAVGIYGLEGSGFQDCTLFSDDGDMGPEDG